MSDNLVNRLRETTHVYQVDCELKMKCADRIEELEADLAKALSALEVGIAKHLSAEKFLEDAKRILAELTGGKDDEKT